jgi:ATP-dependent Clp protease ATP-binding subunit ClpA
VFERFNAQARQVVVRAQREASKLGHAAVQTEHELLGLVGEPDGVAAEVLAELGLTYDTVLEEVVARLGRGSVETPVEQMPFAPPTKKALELSLHEALACGHEHIGPEHLLLAIVRVEEGGASQILGELGADAERVRREVRKRLPGAVEQVSGAARASRHQNSASAAAIPRVRFNAQARQVVVRAQREASKLGHAAVQTEHELLGLVGEPDGVAAEVLAELGLTYDTVLEEVVARLGRGSVETPVEQMPFAPPTKKALELSLHEALACGHEHIGPEHLLLAIVRVEEGGASQILGELGADAERVRREVRKRLPGAVE